MRLAMVFVLFTTFFAAPAAAQPWNVFTPCRGQMAQRARDYGHWRLCEPAAHSELERSFAAPPLADLAGSGRVVRISAIEGDGEPLVAIDAFQQDKQAFAIVRSEADGERSWIMKSALSGRSWDYIAEGALRLANSPAVAPMYERCRAGFSVVVETLGFGEPRALHGKYCDGGAAFIYGRTISDLVFLTFPGCGYPIASQHSFRRLKACVNAAAGRLDLEPLPNGVHLHLPE